MANVVGRGGKVDMMAVIGNRVRSRPMENAVMISDTMGVDSLRTVERMLKELFDAGYPIVFNKRDNQWHYIVDD
jgi:hypothetical protein